MTSSRFTAADFTVGWICAITTEYIPACELLDEEYGKDRRPRYDASQDNNVYSFGRMSEHNVVIACLPEGYYGLTPATSVAENMRRSFRNIRFGLMVGIAGGVPTQNDIRLGDVVVSAPHNSHGGVVQYDFGKAVQESEFLITGHLAPPPQILLGAISKLKMEYKRRGHRLDEVVNEWLKRKPDLRAEFQRPDISTDILYKPDYVHWKQNLCACLDTEQRSNDEIVDREERIEKFTKVFHGNIASANTLLSDANFRDKIATRFNVLCFEMEAAGLMNNFPCVIIRGICDYSDTHKNDLWQGYAAAVAAAYAKDILEVISGEVVESQQVVNFELSSTISTADTIINEYYTLTGRLDVETITGVKKRLDQCYINLSIVEQTDKSLSIDDQSFSLYERLEIQAQSSEEYVALENLFEPRQKDGKTVLPRRIFIQGRAGVGKTTLCKKIVFEYLHGRLGKHLFDRLLWIPLRRLDMDNKEYSWSTLLQNIYSTPNSAWEQVVVPYAKQFSDTQFLTRTMLLFDGLDEVSHELRRGTKFFDFLEHILYNSPNIIITSRPQAKSIDPGHFDLALETIGFSPRQIDSYLDSFVDNKDSRTKIRSFIAARPLIQSLFRIPVQLDAFCCTWHARLAVKQSSSREAYINRQHNIEEVELTSMTTLYHHVAIELHRKDIARLSMTPQPERLYDHQISVITSETLMFLGEMAFQGLVNNVIEYGLDHQAGIELYLSQHGFQNFDISVLDRISFLRTSDIEQNPSKRKYHFIHLTFQEFFAAQHFVKHWISREPLALLRLRPSESQRHVTPFDFLQREKYSGRYNIFWRFVTGLMQLQNKTSSTATSHMEGEEVVSFFEYLHRQPIDIFETGQRRLLANCLSEVIPTTHQWVKALRDKEQEFLRQCAISEYSVTGSLTFGVQTEFPESILCSLLLYERQVPQITILATLQQRSYISTETLMIVSGLLGSQTAAELRLRACIIIFKHAQQKDIDILSYALHVFSSMLEQDQQQDQLLLPILFEMKSYLPNPLSPQAVQGLAKLLKDDNEYVKAGAAILFKTQNTLPLEVMISLMSIIREQSGPAVAYARDALTLWFTLNEEAACAYLAARLFEEECQDLQELIPKILSCQPSFTEEVVERLTAALKSDNKTMQLRAVIAFSNRRSLPEETIDALVSLFMSSDDNSRRTIANVLQMQSILSKTAVASLLSATNHTGASTRGHAVRALTTSSWMHPQVIDRLLQMLDDEDEDDTVVEHIESSPTSQSLPTDIIYRLAAILKKSQGKRRYTVAYILHRNSSLSFIDIEYMIEDKFMLRMMIDTLARQAFLPSHAFTIVLQALEDQDVRVRMKAVEIMAKHGMPLGPAVQKLFKAPNSLPYVTFPVVHRANLYLEIEESSTGIWTKLFTFWHAQSWEEEVLVYQMDECLYLQAQGMSQKLSDTPTRTKTLIRIISAVLQEKLGDRAPILMEPSLEHELDRSESSTTHQETQKRPRTTTIPVTRSKRTRE